MREHGKASDSELPTVSRRGFLGGAGALAGGLAATGLVGGASPAGAEVCGLEWGPRVDLTGLKENFAPQEVKQFTIPAGGIDHLGPSGHRGPRPDGGDAPVNDNDGLIRTGTRRIHGDDGHLLHAEQVEQFARQGARVCIGDIDAYVERLAGELH